MSKFLIHTVISLAGAFVTVAFATWSIDPTHWDRADRQMFLFIAAIIGWLQYADGLFRRRG